MADDHTTSISTAFLKADFLPIRVRLWLIINDRVDWHTKKPAVINLYRIKDKLNASYPAVKMAYRRLLEDGAVVSGEWVGEDRTEPVTPGKVPWLFQRSGLVGLDNRCFVEDVPTHDYVPVRFEQKNGQFVAVPEWPEDPRAYKDGDGVRPVTLHLRCAASVGYGVKPNRLRSRARGATESNPLSLSKPLSPSLSKNAKKSARGPARAVSTDSGGGTGGRGKKRSTRPSRSSVSHRPPAKKDRNSHGAPGARRRWFQSNVGPPRKEDELCACGWFRIEDNQGYCDSCLDEYKERGRQR